jgi:hypothetical protein
MLIVLNHTLVKKKSFLDMGLIYYFVLIVIFAANGFIRSVGFFSAAHICYPLLLDLLRSFST